MPKPARKPNVKCPHCASLHARKVADRYRADGSQVTSYQCVDCHRYYSVDS
jgi:transposase-like protein